MAKGAEEEKFSASRGEERVADWTAHYRRVAAESPDAERKSYGTWRDAFCKEPERLAGFIMAHREGSGRPVDGLTTSELAKCLWLEKRTGSRDPVDDDREDRVNRFLRRGSGISQRDIVRMVKWLEQRRFLWLATRDTALADPADREKRYHNLYAGLTAFFNIGADTNLELGDRVAGRYWIYRPAFIAPSRFLKGLFVVTRHDHNDPVLSCVMTHRHVGDLDKGEGDIVERYEGLLFRKGKFINFLSAQRHPNGDCGPLRLTILHSEIVNEHYKTATMWGMTIAPLGQGRQMMAPVCLDRIPDSIENPESYLRLINRDEVPASVLDRLQINLDQNIVRN